MVNFNQNSISGLNASKSLDYQMTSFALLRLLNNYNLNLKNGQYDLKITGQKSLLGSMTGDNRTPMIIPKPSSEDSNVFKVLPSNPQPTRRPSTKPPTTEEVSTWVMQVAKPRKVPVSSFFLQYDFQQTTTKLCRSPISTMQSTTATGVSALGGRDLLIT